MSKNDCESLKIFGGGLNKFEQVGEFSDVESINNDDQL